MNTEILGEGTFESVRVTLEANETFASEAGKMVRMSGNVTTDVTTRSGGRGGIAAGLKRLAGGDTFFLTTYRASGGPGEVVLAPTHAGGCRVIELDGTGAWMCTGGSYLGSGPGVTTEPRWQGLKGVVSGENLFFIEATGRGPLVIGAFGCISEIDVAGSHIVDSGHVVAFESTLEYTITKAGSSWIQSFLSGEGAVLRLEGSGKLLVQSHNPVGFGRMLGPKLPPRQQ